MIAIATPTALAQFHKALADETRLRLVFLLAELGELCVCDLEAALEISQSKTSRHLRVLKDAGVVADRREGAWIHYRVNDQLAPAGRDAIDALRAALGDSAVGQRDLSRARRCRRGCA